MFLTLQNKFTNKLQIMSIFSEFLTKIKKLKDKVLVFLYFPIPSLKIFNQKRTHVCAFLKKAVKRAALVGAVVRKPHGLSLLIF